MHTTDTRNNNGPTNGRALFKVPVVPHNALTDVAVRLVK